MIINFLSWEFVSLLQNTKNIFFVAFAQKIPRTLFSVFFYPSRRLGISSRRSRGYHQGREAALVSHHALACIFLRLDDIPQQVADDIHAFGVIGTRPLKSPFSVDFRTEICYNLFDVNVR